MDSSNRAPWSKRDAANPFQPDALSAGFKDRYRESVRWIT
jgi:hypothetical protein